MRARRGTWGAALGALIHVACANTASGTVGAMDATFTPQDAGRTTDLGRPMRLDVGGAVFDVNGAPTLAPRQIAPLSTSTVTSTRPTLEWRRPAGASGTRIEICPEPDCRTTEAVIESTTESARPSSSLPAGIHFWRVITQNEEGGTPRPSHVWWFRSPSADTMTDTSHGLHFDYNGDGYGDLALLVQTNEMLIHGRPVVLLGGPDGISASMDRRLILGENLPIYGSRYSWNPPVRLSHVGDLNGDGLSELLLKHYDATDRMNLHLYYGSRSGAGEIILMRTPEGSVDWGDIYPVPVGDFNHDGFADLAVTHVQGQTAARRGTSGIDSFFMGAPQNPEHVGFMLPRPHRAETWFVSPGGDMDGDRRSEFLLYSGEGPLHLVEFDGNQFRVRELSTPRYSPLDIHSDLFIPACDVNGDGYSDLVHTRLFPNLVMGTGRVSAVVLGDNNTFRSVDAELFGSRPLFCTSAGPGGISVVLADDLARLRVTGFPEWSESSVEDSIPGPYTSNPGSRVLTNDYDRNGESDAVLKDPSATGVLNVFHSRSGRWVQTSIGFASPIRTVN
jgi:hypothetical protein